MTSEVQKKIDRYVPAAFEAKWRERVVFGGVLVLDPAIDEIRRGRDRIGQIANAHRQRLDLLIQRGDQRIVAHCGDRDHRARPHG